MKFSNMNYCLNTQHYCLAIENNHDSYMCCILHDLQWLHLPINLMWFSEQQAYQKLSKVGESQSAPCFLAKAAHKYTTEYSMHS